MLSENLDAANAAYEVGYESASQFNREYKRMFGMPPKTNVNRMKNACPTSVRENFTVDCFYILSPIPPLP